MKKSFNKKLIVGLLIVLTVGVLSLFFGGGSNDELVYSEGRPWNYAKLIAPFDIPIEYDSLSTKRIKDSIDKAFIPIYNIKNDVKTKSLYAIDSSLAAITTLKPSIKNQMLAKAKQVFDDGIVDIDTYNKISKNSLSQIRIITAKGNESVTVGVDKLYSEMDAYSAIIDTTSLLNLPEERRISEILHSNIKPTLVYDAAKSSALLEDAYRTALAPNGVKMTGERVIDYGEIVTPQKFTLLKTYERISAENNLSNPIQHFSKYGNIVVILLIMIAFYLFIRILHPVVYHSLRSMVFLFSFVFVFVLLVYLIALLRPGFLYIVPFALVAIVVTIFFNTSLGFLTHTVVVLLCSFVAIDSIDFVIMQFLAGIIAIVSIKGLMQRSQLVVCALFIFLCYTVTYVAQHLVRHGTLGTLDWHVILYFAVNCIVLSFAYFVIFIVEKIFGFTSQVTLVELSDINNEVLQELSENCPGTFQHSLQVATLAGEAARQIGANVQLVRAGALYHDIGKIDNPAFFTENQSGVNPHDVLQPEQSAAIVISHVTDGLRRAEKAKLPEVVKDLIAQHHGTGKTRYFYNKALKQSATGNVPVEPYTYPGPNPTTREASILMMADACEAAAKSLANPNEESITSIVDKVIEGQINDGMFNDSPISFKDIYEVKKCLIKRLLTFYHTRVSYPDDVKPVTTATDDMATTTSDE